MDFNGRGSSTGEQRAKREKLLPVFKRRLMGDLLDFIAREMRVQTQVLAAASAGVASYGLPLEVSKAEVENAALLSEALVENAVVILMLVEDHLRLQSKLFSSTRNQTASASPISSVLNATMSPSARGDSSNDSAIPFDYEKAPEGSDRKTEARKKFAEAMSHRMHLDSSIELIGKVLFGMEKGSTVMKTVRSAGKPLVDDWTCLKTLKH